MRLVLDASVAAAAAATPVGFVRFRRFELVALPLMWIEAVSTLHAMVWRGELRRDQAEPVRERVLSAPVQRCEPDELAREAWRIADELGWAKTYDANYVALARLLGCMNIKIGPLSFDHVHYDAENDLLYLHVGEPQAGDGEETPEGHVIRYAPGTNRIVGLTVMGPRHILEREGHLVVTVPEAVEITSNELASALAAV